jgi:uncharacterized membrane protein (DUF2068 family)
MTSTRKSRRVHRKVKPGFVAVIVFKCLKGLAFVIFGIAALRLSRLKVMPTAIEIAQYLSVSKENELVHRVADLIADVTPRQVTAAGLASLFVAVVFFVEGVLLAAQIWWSTYFTIALTALGIPLELYEIAHRPGSIRRWALLAVNAAILAFLWYRRNEFRSEMRVEKAPAPRKRATG